MDFKEFKEKYYGKSVEEIEKGLKSENLIKRDVETVDIIVRATDVAGKILSIEHSVDYFYIFKEYFLTYINELDLFLDIDGLPDFESVVFEDYDCFIKEYLETIPTVKLFIHTIKDIIDNVHYDTINELGRVLQETNISNDDLERAEKSLNEMFNGQSDERLKLIESILAYNDPNLKAIKDFIYDSGVSVKDINNTQKNIGDDVNVGVRQTLLNVTDINTTQMNDMLQEDKK